MLKKTNLEEQIKLHLPGASLVKGVMIAQRNDDFRQKSDVARRIQEFLVKHNPDTAFIHPEVIDSVIYTQRASYEDEWGNKEELPEEPSQRCARALAEEIGITDGYILKNTTEVVEHSDIRGLMNNLLDRACNPIRALVQGYQKEAEFERYAYLVANSYSKGLTMGICKGLYVRNERTADFDRDDMCLKYALSDRTSFTELVDDFMMRVVTNRKGCSQQELIRSGFDAAVATEILNSEISESVRYQEPDMSFVYKPLEVEVGVKIGIWKTL